MVTLAPPSPSTEPFSFDSSPSEPKFRFKLSQCFGEATDDFSQADILSAIEFDQSGEYLAAGDQGGRVVIFKQNAPVRKKLCANGRMRRFSDFKLYHQFQSHEQEFDYLKSLEIEEKINQIKWCNRVGRALFLLSTNDKTVKLWRMKEVPDRSITEDNEGVNDGDPALPGDEPVTKLMIPRTDRHREKLVSSKPRCVFANAHTYHIHSVDPNNDGEHFISADDLRINLWSMENADQTFNIVDIKPSNFEELKEVITCSRFCPKNANLLMYSTSRGCIKAVDLRVNANGSDCIKTYEEPSSLARKTMYSEIVSSISDIKLTSCGRHIVSRDYMSLKLWDARKETSPLQKINVHEHLRPKLESLYKNDCIFDKFECDISGDNRNVVTGSYNGLCSLYSANGMGYTAFEASSKEIGKKMKWRGIHNGEKKLFSNVQSNGSVDFDSKILHMSWNPRDDVIAVAGVNILYLFTSQIPL